MAETIMKIVEYKKHLVDGYLVDPEFIFFGNVFNDNVNNTWIGKVLDEAERKYYIPDTLVELTREELIQRALSLNLKKLTSENDPHSETINLNEQEIAQLVDTWINTYAT